MDFRDYPRPLRAAIEAIVDENTSLHVATVIEDDDARPYLTDDVMNAFWVVQRANDYAQHILTEALQDLDEGEEATLHSAIATGCNASVGRIISGALRDYVTHWLAKEAEAHRDAREAADEGQPALRTSFGAWVDDPVIGDRRAIARGAL
jgi:hypothetical protein